MEVERTNSGVCNFLSSWPVKLDVMRSLSFLAWVVLHSHSFLEPNISPGTGVISRGLRGVQPAC